MPLEYETLHSRADSNHCYLTLRKTSKSTIPADRFMLEPPPADQAKAVALVKTIEGGIFTAVVDHLGYIGISIFLSIAAFVSILLPLPDLSGVAMLTILFILMTSFLIGSIFALRKLRARYYRALRTIYAELFFEGFEEEQVVRLVGGSMMYIRLPKRPTDRKKREVEQCKDALWKLDDFHGG